MKKPKVFVNSINKNIKNNIESYHYRGSIEEEIDELEIIDESISIEDKLNDIFNSDSFVYKNNVVIILKDGNSLKEEVIAIKNLELITLSGKKIKLTEIKDIKKAN